MSGLSHFLAAAAFVTVLGVMASGASADDLKVGDAAPDFSLAGSDGQTHSLKDYQDKQVVLAQY